jgi:hypothetical protein
MAHTAANFRLYVLPSTGGIFLWIDAAPLKTRLEAPAKAFFSPRTYCKDGRRREGAIGALRFSR